MKKIILGLATAMASNLIFFQVNAQTITTPVGVPLSISSSMDVAGDINLSTSKVLKVNSITVFRINTSNSSLFIGDQAGNLAATGASNTCIGSTSGANLTTGSNNYFIGASAGVSNTTGNNNFFIGNAAGFGNLGGQNNTFLGNLAGNKNKYGQNNLMLGADAGTNTGLSSVSLGDGTASENVFIGSSAGRANDVGNNNTFIGVSSGYNNVATNNTFVGQTAGYLNTTGNLNTYIGAASGGGPAITNATAIGCLANATTSNTVVLGNAATTITGAGLAAGQTGLRFANVSSATTPTAVVGGNKILTVDGSGNVVLGTLAAGTINSVGGPVAEKTWKEQDGYLYNNSTNGVVINGSGLDGNSLIVKGGVLSKEVNVKVEGSESWPDYVFKPSYKRMSLDEVEKFININGHLPNVASATEMATTGNNLNKTDIKLLEKVEELTLYLLEMKKSNEAQNAEIQNLKKQVKSLRRK